MRQVESDSLCEVEKIFKGIDLLVISVSGVEERKDAWMKRKWEYWRNTMETGNEISQD